MKYVVFVVLLMLGAAAAPAQDRVIRVTGQGSVQVVPDQATISLGVVSRAKSAREALGGNAKAMTALIAVLARAGVEERLIQTSRLSLNPDYARELTSLPGQDPVIVAYIADTQVQVVIHDIAALGGVLDDLTRAGTNQIGGIFFSVRDPEPLMNDARRLAVADARARAELYADAAGVALGEVLLITDAPMMSPPSPMAMARVESFAADMPVAAGEIGIGAQVTVEFALK